jgi:hypothetical protein
MRPDVAFVYVRDLIERITGVRPDPDTDGDLPVHFHGAQFFVRVIASAANPWIQVFSVAVADVQESPGLMTRLNQINASSTSRARSTSARRSSSRPRSGPTT